MEIESPPFEEHILKRVTACFSDGYEPVMGQLQIIKDSPHADLVLYCVIDEDGHPACIFIKPMVKRIMTTVLDDGIRYTLYF